MGSLLEGLNSHCNLSSLTLTSVYSYVLYLLCKDIGDSADVQWALVLYKALPGTTQTFRCFCHTADHPGRVCTLCTLAQVTTDCRFLGTYAWPGWGCSEEGTRPTQCISLLSSVTQLLLRTHAFPLSGR